MLKGWIFFESLTRLATTESSKKTLRPFHSLYEESNFWKDEFFVLENFSMLLLQDVLKTGQSSCLMFQK